jgi:hypothetical protein
MPSFNSFSGDLSEDLIDCEFAIADGCDEVVNPLEAELTGDPTQITRLQEFGCVEVVLMKFFLQKFLP